MYGFCTAQKKCVYGSPPFRIVWPTLQTPTYKFAKVLVSILEPLPTKNYTVKDSLNFATEIVDQVQTFIHF